MKRARSRINPERARLNLILARHQKEMRYWEAVLKTVMRVVGEQK